ncbi:MAG TPA: outer membrane lipoprotein carrier protein LolA [Paracoccaceae bacterium]|nr:outer membrane lipoprotein carrier protein LolA [Paracoccaceae bacterium]
MIMRRTFLAASALACIALTGARAEGGADVARISAYLNAIGTLAGSFVQTNPDGSISEGKFFIRKPGLMRFEYEPPNPALVIADGVWVGVIDRRSNTDAQRYPLSDTPLDLLLRDRVDLAKEGAVRKVEREEGQLRVTAHDPDAPKRGTLTLVFSDNPLELRQWIVVDETGKVTTVVLSEMRRDIDLDRTLFNIEFAERNRKRSMNP